jgi:hypothetical protein
MLAYAKVSRFASHWQEDSNHRSGRNLNNWDRSVLAESVDESKVPIDSLQTFTLPESSQSRPYSITSSVHNGMVPPNNALIASRSETF